MTNRELAHLLRGLAAFLIALPSTLALVPDLHLTPTANAMLLVVALAGATLMSQLPPAAAPRAARKADLDDLIGDVEKLSPEQRKEMAGRLALRAERAAARKAKAQPPEGQ